MGNNVVNFLSNLGIFQSVRPNNPLPVTPISTPGSPIEVVGNVASGAADSGNPVKVGAKYNLAIPVFADGNRTDFQSDSRGNIRVSAILTTHVGADGFPNNQMGLTQSSTAQAFPLMAEMGGYAYNTASADWSRIRTINGINPLTTSQFALASANVAHTQAGGAVAPNATTAVASNLVLKAAAGNLYRINVVAGAVGGYVMLFDAVTAPADGAVTPVKCIPLAANAGLDWDFAAMPIRFNTGIVAVFSSTGPYLKTASATAFIEGEAV